MLEKLKQYLRNYKDSWLTHWRYMPWRNRAILSAKIGTGIIILLTFTILGIWVLLGSPSNTAELKRNIDHHLRFSKPTIQSLEASGDLPTLDRSVEIAGSDKNANGIRDDIDAYIDRKAREGAWTPAQVKAMQQDARAMQAIVTVDVKNKKALDRADKMQTNSGWCKALQFGKKFDYPEYDLEPLTVNTKERIIAYIGYNSAASGSVTEMPTGDTCDH